MAFTDFFPKNANGQAIIRTAPEALAAFPYEEELHLKQEAFAAFLKDSGLPVSESLVPSPLARRYRTTGKRRITVHETGVFLHFGRVPGKEPVADSRLEPEAHLAVYRTVQKMLSLPHFRAAARAANYCIVRGGGNDRALILNVRRFSGDVIRELRTVAETVRNEVPTVRSAFLYLDESGSDYYLEAERPEGKLNWKKLFGPDRLALRIAAPEPKKFLYSPVGFSQINESILPAFTAVLQNTLTPGPDDQLLDLYCGYGLWSLLLAPSVHSVWGAELSREAVLAARGNAVYHYPHRDLRFEIAAIEADYLREKLPPHHGDHELILLDPPRQGTRPGVLETLISRRPRLLAHVFCGVDEIPAALKIYRANGCEIQSILPFDFFPGTLNLEVLVILRPPR